MIDLANMESDYYNEGMKRQADALREEIASVEEQIEKCEELLDEIETLRMNYLSFLSNNGLENNVVDLYEEVETKLAVLKDILQEKKDELNDNHYGRRY